ncbi:MAG: hypothetical protein Q9159_003620 [Coniocarpon cinnabarinum]
MEICGVNDFPNLQQLYNAGVISPAHHDDVFQPLKTNATSRIYLIKADITKLRVDAIMNAANESLLGGGGVDGAIHRAAGPGLLDACRDLHGCATGSAKITHGFDLPAKFVIHAVGPMYSRGRQHEENAAPLASCYKTTLDLAASLACKSVAFSCVSTGIYGFPNEEAAEIVCRLLREYFDSDLEHKAEAVLICCFLDKDMEAYSRCLPFYFPPHHGEASQETEPQTEQDKMQGNEQQDLQKDQQEDEQKNEQIEQEAEEQGKNLL